MARLLARVFRPPGRPWEGTGVEPLIKGQSQSEGIRARASRRAPAPGARAVSLCGTSSDFEEAFGNPQHTASSRYAVSYGTPRPGGTPAVGPVSGRETVSLCAYASWGTPRHTQPQCVWKRGRSIQPSQNLPSNVLSHCNLQAVGRTRLSRAETRLVREQRTHVHPQTGMPGSIKVWCFTLLLQSLRKRRTGRERWRLKGWGVGKHSGVEGQTEGRSNTGVVRFDAMPRMSAALLDAEAHFSQSTLSRWTPSSPPARRGAAPPSVSAHGPSGRRGVSVDPLSHAARGVHSARLHLFLPSHFPLSFFRFPLPSFFLKPISFTLVLLLLYLLRRALRHRRRGPAGAARRPPAAPPL